MLSSDGLLGRERTGSSPVNGMTAELPLKYYPRKFDDRVYHSKLCVCKDNMQCEHVPALLPSFLKTVSPVKEPSIVSVNAN